MLKLKDATLGVVGLGYVGLPLAVTFARLYHVIGFDIKPERIEELGRGLDRTLEVSSENLAKATGLRLTWDEDELAGVDMYIVTVPTPIDRYKNPDLRPLESACTSVGKTLRKGGVVIFESTVYPGCTEEICVPILEKASGLKFNRDFYVGYSPERINPGDHEHRFETIVKVTSGSTPEAADLIDALYRSVVKAGTHRASSIRVAEAAKVIENTQRDVNIALVNELALIFERLGLDSTEVFEAAGTKWNFLPFRPGLVGGHCIGVDPYYLTHKCQDIGYQPEVILAGRRINDSIGAHVADTVIKLLTMRRIHVVDARILILGLTFKENCPDLRNTKVIDIVREFETYHANPVVYDPWANAIEAKHEYGIDLANELQDGIYDAVILAVAHREFMKMGPQKIRALLKPGGLVYDVKSALPRDAVDARL